MGKRFVAAIVMSFMLMACACYVIYSKNQKEYNSELVQYGQIEAKRIESWGSSNRVEKIKGNQIVIYKDDYEAVVEELINFGMKKDVAVEEAETMLLREEALYILAVNDGQDVSDEEVWSIIQQNKDQMPDSDTYKDFQLFLQGAEMTSDEYWDSQFTRLKRNTIIMKYQDKCMQESGEYKDSNDRTQEYEELVKEKFNEIADSFIQKDEIVRLGSDT